MTLEASNMSYDDNIDLLEEDIFNDMENYKAIHDALDVWDEIHVFIHIILGLFSLSACIFLLIAFIKFKHLQKPLYLYFLNFNLVFIVSICTQLCTGILFISKSTFKPFGWSIIIHFEQTCNILSFVFITLPALHWYGTLNKFSWQEKCEKYYKYVILFCYGLAIVKLVLNFILSLSFNIFESGLIIQMCYLISLITILVVNYLVRKNPNYSNDKDKFILIISTFVILSWLPMYCMHFTIGIVQRFSAILRIILVFLLDFPQFVTMSLPVIITILLGRFNKHFKMAYDQLLRVRKNYDIDETLDDELEE